MSFCSETLMASQLTVKKSQCHDNAHKNFFTSSITIFPSLCSNHTVLLIVPQQAYAHLRVFDWIILGSFCLEPSSVCMSHSFSFFTLLPKFNLIIQFFPDYPINIIP